MEKVSALFFSITCLCVVALSDNSVSIGTNNCSVHFSDTAIPVDRRNLICEDLSRYFSYNPYIGMVFEMSSQTNRYPLCPICDSQHATNMLDNVELAMLPNGTYEICVTKDLTDTYQNILLRHPFALSQISNAVTFVSHFNSGAVTNYSNADKCRLFRTLESPNIPTQTEEIASGLVSFWCTQKYSLPSLIDWKKQTIWNGHPDIPVLPVRVCSSQTNGILSSATHYIGAISNDWFFIAY